MPISVRTALISGPLGGVFTYSMISGSMPSARIIASTLHDVVHFGLCQITTAIRFQPRTSRARRAAHIDAGAIAAGDFRIGEAQDHHPPIEGDDLAILRAAGLARRADIIPPAGRALETQL